MQNGSVVPLLAVLARTFVLASVGLVLASCNQDVTDPLTGDEMSLSSHGKKSQTAQSVMIELIGPSDFIIQETKTYSYDWSGQPAAVAAFDTYFTLSTTGTVNASQQNTAKHNAFKAPNRCHFFGGTALQQVVSGFGAGRSATATPKAPGMYAAKTGWSVEVDGDGPVDVSLDEYSFIAAQSALQKSSGNSGWTKKFSFSLDETRIAGFDVRMLDAYYNVIAPTYGMSGISMFSPGQEFEYEGNAGSNGLLSLLKDGWVSQTLLGTNSSGDNFPGNDGEGAVKALLNPMTWTLGTGEYTLKATGTVKGVEGAASTEFVGTKQVTVVGGC